MTKKKKKINKYILKKKNKWLDEYLEYYAYYICLDNIRK